MSYQAIIASLKNVRKHSNADRLQLASVAGFQVVVGKDNYEGELGVFFPCDGVLSPEHLKENNLYSRAEFNKDSNVKGYFPNNGRVRAIRLRGEISEGVWMKLSSLEWTGANLDFRYESETFDTIGNKKICQKYINEETIKAAGGGKKKTKIYSIPTSELVPGFRKHIDTEQLRTQAKRIPTGAILTSTAKLHGTSMRTSRARSRQIKSRLYNLLNYLQDRIEKTDKKFFRRLMVFVRDKIGRYLRNNPPKRIPGPYVYVSGSRNTTMNPNKDFNEFSKDFYRGKWHNKIKSIGLRKGETLYYEVVGFTETGNPIMGKHGIEDEGLKSMYGDKVVFSYGCDSFENKNDIYVYRITMNNEDDQAVEYPWWLVKKRCNELGLKYVPEIGENPFIYDGNKDELITYCNGLVQGKRDVIDSKHPLEGLVVRVEHERMLEWFKIKNWDFIHLEDKAKEEGQIDVEEVESLKEE